MRILSILLILIHLYMRKYIVSLFLIVPVYLFIFNSAHASADHLWINQVQISGAKTTDDFIEIYNPTSADVDLKDWQLLKKTKPTKTNPDPDESSVVSFGTSDTTTIIKSHGFYLWANSGFNTISATPDSVRGAYISDDNAIALRQGSKATGIIIDSVGWGSVTNNFIEGSAFPTNPGVNKSLLRSTDTDNNATDFTIVDSNPHNSSTATGVSSEPAPNSSPDSTASEPVAPPEPVPDLPKYSRDISISEFLVNPDGPDDGEEWVELFNPTAQEVDLSNWIIDDEGDPGVIGKDAYTFPDTTTIKPGDYFVVNLPEASFALNNTGGDTVRLFWPDKNLASQISYTDTAKTDQAYARKLDGTYAWTTLVTKGKTNQFPEANLLEGVTSAAENQIKLNEIFPDPKGPDGGAEWVEVRNEGTEPVYLHNWTLDDGEPSAEIGSSAYKIESPIVYPGGLAVITIPAGKFTMNNTGHETVRLFNENKVLIDSLSYDDAKEDLSYQFLSGKWAWGTPSPNAVNALEVEQAKEALVNIVINEIFPEPPRGSKQEEFIELFNPSDKDIDLTGYKIADLSSSYKLTDTIKAHGFLVIKKSDSNISLNNSGKEEVTLADPKGVVVASLEYEDAPKDESYNLTDDGTYVWSSTLTPGQINVLKSVTVAGQVLGATLPRTGNDSRGLGMVDAFVIWTIVWYIYVKLSDKKLS
jgi:hypothetical protein